MMDIHLNNNEVETKKKRILIPEITSEEGILINLISRELLDSMTPEQRVRFIVDEVKRGKVLVLERGLNAIEEMELIRLTMEEIDHNSFIGVETPGFSIDLKKIGLLRKLLGRRPPPRMMVVGPADLLRTIRKDGHVIQAMILTRSTVKSLREDMVPLKPPTPSLPLPPPQQQPSPSPPPPPPSPSATVTPPATTTTVETESEVIVAPSGELVDGISNNQQITARKPVKSETEKEGEKGEKSGDAG